MPVRRPGVIERPDLVKQFLNSAEAPMVVIAAPPGYGKSTAVQLWSETDERPFAWVHLAAVDDDPVHLLRHVTASIGQVAPVDDAVVRVVSGPGRPIDTEILPALGLAISMFDPFVLVLDDVHLLQSAPALLALDGLFRYLPGGSQAVLLGRGMPELHLARRRLAGQVVEFGPEDLMMGCAEARSLFFGADLNLDDEAVEDLLDRTEGWPAGLGLAALALRQNRDPDWNRHFSGRNRVVADYLVEEVLEGLGDDTTDFLLRSSVLDRLNIRLLDELLDVDDSARSLHELQRSANPFLIPLDSENQWFRYHHLFAEVLQERLRITRPGEFLRLHARASNVLERRGDLDGSIRHAIAAGESDRAADLVLVNTLRVIDEGRIGLLGQWIDLLGPELVDRHPSAAIASAWYGVSIVDPAVIARSIHSAEALSWDGPLADGSPSLGVAVAAVRALVAAEGTEGVMRDTAIVRAGGGPAVNPWWGFVTALQGSAATLAGDNDHARELLTAGLAHMAGSPSFEAGYLGILALVEVEDGRLIDAERHAHRAMDLCERHNLEGVILDVHAYAAAALVAAKAGRADQARATSIQARRLLARLGDMSPRSALRGYVALAQAALALGDFAGAQGLVQDAALARERDPSCCHLNDLLDEVESSLTRVGAEAVGAAPITSAELRVLSYLPTHMSLQEIAAALYVSRNTVKSHSIALYRKLGVSSRSEAVDEARRLGLLGLDGAARSHV